MGPLSANGKADQLGLADHDEFAPRARGECLAAALDYLDRGWSVVPCCPPGHVGVGREHARACEHPGKGPLVRWKEFQDRRPSVADLRRWWREWPNANVYLLLGPVSRLVRVDVDGEDGEAFLRERSGGEIPPTLEFLSSARCSSRTRHRRNCSTPTPRTRAG
jgi:hypothetical protein